MIIGKPPFETNDVKTTYKKIKMNSYVYPENVKISTQAKNLINKLLQLNPKNRITLNDIMNHEFLNQGIPIPQ